MIGSFLTAAGLAAVAFALVYFLARWGAGFDTHAGREGQKLTFWQWISGR